MKTRIYEDLSDLYTLWRDTSLGEEKSETREVDFLDALFKIRQIKTVIDLGGGVGLHTLGLLEKGYDVTLFDQSEKALSIAKERNLNLKTVHGSFENMEVDAEFEASICMWSTLSYVWGEEAQRHFYTWIANHTGKLIVLDEPNFSLYPTDFHKVYIGEDAGRTIKITRDWVMEGAIKRTKFLYEVADKTTNEIKTFEDQEVQQYLTLEEIQNFLGEQWQMKKVYGDYNLGADFDPRSSTRMVAVFENTKS